MITTKELFSVISKRAYVVSKKYTRIHDMIKLIVELKIEHRTLRY